MSVSQMIYTGCGKYKNGEFSVWSKSADVSENEVKEIRDTMGYKSPKGLPYEPTKEELASLFPKKFGYFYLTSGRVCMAQSVYVGRAYSDADSRIGNFMLHAFIFDKSEDLLPMDYIESNLFRRELTYEEWHDKDAPDELPKVEIGSDAEILAMQDVIAFFRNGSRIEGLKLLLQAMMNASDTEQKITFYDKPKNLRYWYKAVSACLPKSMQKKLTLDTYFIGEPPRSVRAVGNSVDVSVKIRNIITDDVYILSRPFSYQQEAGAGKYAFDFEKGISPSGIVVTKYVHKIVDIFLKDDADRDKNLVEQIGKIGDTCDVDLDAALDVYFLLDGQIEETDDMSEAELEKAIQLVKKHYRDKLSDIADRMYEYGLKTGKWVPSRAIAKIYRFIFDYSSTADKDEMIHTYIVNQEAFGVETGLDCDSYCISFKNNAPFAWENFLDYILNSDKRYIKENGTFNSSFLVFHTFTESMSKIRNDKAWYDIATKYMVDTVKRYIQKEQLTEVLHLVRCFGKDEAKLESRIIEMSYGLLCKDGKQYSDVCSLKFTLDLAEACGNIDVAKCLILRLISENEKNKDFIKLYVGRRNHKEAFYKRLDPDIKLSYADFLENVKKYEFEILPVVTKQKLQEYYDEYFSVGKDDGVFQKKLRQYLFEYYGKERINESLRCYQNWVEPQRRSERILKQKVVDSCVEVVCEAFDSSPIEVLREYVLQEKEKNIQAILFVSQNSSHSVQGKVDAIICGEDIKKLTAELKSKKQLEQVLEKIKKETFYCIPEDDSSRNLFVKMYLVDIFSLYFAVTDKDKAKYEQVFCQLFFPIHGCTAFRQFFYDEMSKLNTKQYESFLCDAAVCVCCGSNGFREEMRQFIVNIFEAADKGKREKLFTRMLEQTSSEHMRGIEEFRGQWKEKREQKEQKSNRRKFFGR